MRVQGQCASGGLDRPAPARRGRRRQQKSLAGKASCVRACVRGCRWVAYLGALSAAPGLRGRCPSLARRVQSNYETGGGPGPMVRAAGGAGGKVARLRVFRPEVLVWWVQRWAGRAACIQTLWEQRGAGRCRVCRALLGARPVLPCVHGRLEGAAALAPRQNLPAHALRSCKERAKSPLWGVGVGVRSACVAAACAGASAPRRALRAWHGARRARYRMRPQRRVAFGGARARRPRGGRSTDPVGPSQAAALRGMAKERMRPRLTQVRLGRQSWQLQTARRGGEAPAVGVGLGYGGGRQRPEGKSLKAVMRLAPPRCVIGPWPEA